jgi:hypothetical protein
VSKPEFAKRAKAHTVYKLADGTRVPGTTTITGLLAKPALIKWANNLGLEGIDSNKYVDAAATVGTLAHEMVEAYLRKERLDLTLYSPDDIKRARRAFRKFVVWSKSVNLRPLFLERPMVSEMQRFGGTIDFYGDRNGVPTLIDFKTSKALYPEHLLQVAAYALLLHSNDFEVRDVYILRIGRDEGEGFEERKVDQIGKRWELFKHLLEVYRLRKELR